MVWTRLKWLREIGVCLLTSSLLFLPWYLDPSPADNQSPLITGSEFITSRSWSVIMAYGLTLVAFIISRFSTRKWIGFVPLGAAGLLYFLVHFTVSTSMSGYYGIALDRHISSLESYGAVEALIGIPVNCIGLFTLLVGLFATVVGGPKRTANVNTT
jgi:hypothetical protein